MEKEKFEREERMQKEKIEMEERIAKEKFIFLKKKKMKDNLN